MFTWRACPRYEDLIDTISIIAPERTYIFSPLKRDRGSRVERASVLVQYGCY